MYRYMHVHKVTVFDKRYLWYVAVFGKVGLHMVLRGAVKPITDPHLNESNEVPDSRSSTPLLPEDNEKEVNLIKIFWLKFICFRWKKKWFLSFLFTLYLNHNATASWQWQIPMSNTTSLTMINLKILLVIPYELPVYWLWPWPKGSPYFLIFFLQYSMRTLVDSNSKTRPFILITVYMYMFKVYY